MWERIQSEEGIGVVTALMVAFIVFALGATWHSLSVHELDEVAFDRNRTQAVHAADAGVRAAMALLAQESTVRQDIASAGEYNSGIDGSGQCQLETVLSSADQVGEYWIRIIDSTPAEPNDFNYFIESWGWSPGHQARQANDKKAELEVELFPLAGFDYGIFAAAGLALSNNSTIWGDVYSGADALVNNNISVYDNDAGFPGDGHLEVFGRLEIGSGSDVDVEGMVRVNRRIDDNHPGDTFGQDVISVYDDGYFRDAQIGGTVKLGGVLVSGSDVNGAPVVQGAVGLDPVPSYGLPVFGWDPTTGTLHNTWSDFRAWYNANRSNLSGRHFVAETANYGLWNLGQGAQRAQFADDFLLAIKGDLEITGKPVSIASEAITLTVAGDRDAGTLGASDLGSKIILSQNLQFNNDDLRLLGYAIDTIETHNNSTIYGALYAESGVTGNLLQLKFRPPTEDALSGFSFAASGFDTEPGVWREVPPAGLTTHCSLP